MSVLETCVSDQMHKSIGYSNRQSVSVPWFIVLVRSIIIWDPVSVPNLQYSSYTALIQHWINVNLVEMMLNQHDSNTACLLGYFQNRYVHFI